MKSVLLSLFIYGIIGFSQYVNGEYSQCSIPSFDWVAFDSGVGQSMGYGLASDADGIWIAGSFRNTLKLGGPGGSLQVQSAQTHTDVNNDDIYIAKIGFDGTPLQIKDFEGFGRQVLIDATVDNTRNRLLIAGYYLGNITFKADETLVNTKALGSLDFDGVIVSLDISGGNPVAVWTKSYVNTKVTKYSALAIDNSGNVIAVGTTCEPDPAGVPNPVTGRIPDKCFGIVVALAVNTGELMWQHKLFGFNPQGINGDGTNKLYITGSITSTSLNFPGFGSISKLGVSDAIVAQINSADGTFNWVKSIGFASQTLSGWDLVVGINHVYVAGSETGKNFDGFFMKLVKTSGTISYHINVPSSRGIILNNAETAIYLMGLFNSDLVMSNSLTLKTRGDYDIFLLKLAISDGSGVWGINAGAGNGLEYPWTMAKDPNGNLYLTGLSASSSVDFDDEQFIDVSVGYNNVFIAKLRATNENMPICLVDCNTVVTDRCFINNVCYSTGEKSPFYNQQCFSCNPSKSKTSWTGPDLTSYCFIDNACIANSKPRGSSRCQYCDVSKSTTSWSVKPGYKVANDGSTCESDGSVPNGAVVPGCASGQTYNENYCGSVHPCYDSVTNQCVDAVSVCTNGRIYSTDCPEYPKKPCYNTASHTCEDANADDGTKSGVFCGNTGQYIYISECPSTHPCYDHINRICTQSQVMKSNALLSSTTNDYLTYIIITFNLLLWIFSF